MGRDAVAIPAIRRHPARSLKDFTALANAADSGDAAGAQTAAAAVDKAVTDYVAQYPG